MFKIDFFELCFLAEACIPPVPIARACFWLNLTDKYYKELSKDQRKKLFEWMTRLDKLDLTNDDCLLFYNRYNPDNQYTVTPKLKDQPETEYKPIEAFKHNSKYHISSTRYIEPNLVGKVEKLIH